MNTLIRLKKTTPVLVIAFVLAWFALSPTAQAVVPAPDGGYPGFNTAEGQNALFSLTTGAANTAVGWYSLFSNTEGDFNTAAGAGALLFNTARENTAFGTAALLFNTAGVENTAVGAAALVNNTSINNTAIGAHALQNNTTGGGNTAIGRAALFGDSGNGFGNGNSAIGVQALLNNTTGSFNTAIGYSALANNTTGVNNIGLGYNAGIAITSGTNIIAIGAFVDGVSVGGQLDNSCYIGNIKDAQIDGTTASAVMVDQDGKLGTTSFPSQGGHQISFNDLLKQQKQMQNLEAAVAVLTAQLKEQAAQIQKVSAELEASKPATQVVNNP